MRHHNDLRLRNLKMLRIATPQLLIMLVLICPQLCRGKAVVAPCEAHGCCCAERSDSSGNETPAPSDESEPDCLCQGAIMDNVRSTELDLPTPLAVNWRIDDPILSSSALFLAEMSLEPPHQFPPFSSGRDVCVLACALLL